MPPTLTRKRPPLPPSSVPSLDLPPLLPPLLTRTHRNNSWPLLHLSTAGIPSLPMTTVAAEEQKEEDKENSESDPTPQLTISTSAPTPHLFTSIPQPDLKPYPFTYHLTSPSISLSLPLPPSPIVSSSSSSKRPASPLFNPSKRPRLTHRLPSSPLSTSPPGAALTFSRPRSFSSAIPLPSPPPTTTTFQTLLFNPHRHHHQIPISSISPPSPPPLSPPKISHTKQKPLTFAKLVLLNALRIHHRIPWRPPPPPVPPTFIHPPRPPKRPTPLAPPGLPGGPRFTLDVPAVISGDEEEEKMETPDNSPGGEGDVEGNEEEDLAFPMVGAGGIYGEEEGECIFGMGR